MFKSKNFCHIASNNRNTVKVGVFVYRTTDDLDTVTASGYFNERIIDINLHDLIIHEQIDIADNTKVTRNVLCVTERTLDNVIATVVNDEWQSDIEQEIEDLEEYVDETFVKKDGSSIMTGPLKFRAGSFEGAIAGGLGDGISIYKLKADGSIDSEVASITKTNGFVPGTNNSMDIGRNNVKWKDLYVARVITSVLNNGANINVPTTAGTLGLNDFSNITDSAKNIANWSSNVSNCITEIPQDITLTLSSGTLSVKSGSKVYFPNGANTFTAYTFATDKTVSMGTNGKYLVGIGNNSKNVALRAFASTTSGTTDSMSGQGYHWWYDTTNNVIKSYGSDASTPNDTISLPIAIITVSSGAISSIDQVFNGFGFIGSTVFALPGVKGLIPNGRNSDGTLKNIVINNSSVRTNTASARTDGDYDWYFRNSNTQDIVSPNARAYDSNRNIIYSTGSGDVLSDRFLACKIKWESNKVILLVSKPVFHAVDYSDLSTVALSGSYDDLINKPTVAYPSLFDNKWADHTLTDMSWLRADTFSWNSGLTYSNAYNHLVADIDGKSLSSETIGGTTVQFYLADDGHKICPATEESNVSAIYTATGVAWYYVLDIGNTRFKLPRTQFGFTGLRDAVGKYVEAGLPNITGTFKKSYTTFNGDNTYSGAFSQVSEVSHAMDDGGSATGHAEVSFDASLSSSIYGSSDTVQPKATQMYLYFYVGQFTQSALQETAGLNASLFNGKVDLDGSNATFPHVIEKQDPTVDNDYTWYRKYSDGWVEQGGYQSSSGGTSGVTVNLPVAMSDANYTVVATVTAEQAYFVGCLNKTETSFLWRSMSDNGAGYDKTGYWQVSGKAA